ncbi:lipid-A-disaccharide synthase [Pannus brasiliensis CCIBt3594]|uniref:Lipid-A-disaccharide synthase n=1 Tax=Pannus brasiliensis CCIBt3594 TaxID=1427578 RepID=A0AAW9QFZ5_9CHRO
MRIFISTGEVSGDLQAAMLVESLFSLAKEKGIDLEIVALGGDRMEAAGATMIGKTTRLASMGLIESIPFILPTLQLQKRAKESLRSNPPDILILIDYVGPNVAIGSFAREALPDLPIVYYIGPQVWIWSEENIPSASLRAKAERLFNTKKLIEITDRLLAIFPAEERFFKAKGLPVTWVGHPLVDRMADPPKRLEMRQKWGIREEETAIALLPASRQQEFKYLVPTVCAAARQLQDKLTDVRFLIPVPLALYRPRMEELVKEYGLNATILERDQTLEAIAAADLAVAKSGTVNLEIAMLNVPQVVVYRLSPITAWIARNIMKLSVPYVSPVNLVLMREIVPELLQEEANTERIAAECLDLLLNTQRREKMLLEYAETREGLGTVGTCDRVAREIFQMVGKQ